MGKLSFLFFLLVSFFVKAQQAPSIEWARCYGGSNLDIAHSVRQTTDGGFAIAGLVRSSDGDISGFLGEDDFWLVKIDIGGNIQWQKCLGGSGKDVPLSMQQTVDAGYILAGWTESNDSFVSGNHGFADCWVIKLDSASNVQWQKCLGGHNIEFAHSIEQTLDGGYIVAAETESNNFDVSGNHGGSDCWVVKLDSAGNIEWQKCLGGSDDDVAFSIQQINNGGYILAGWTQSNNGDVAGNHGLYDSWVVKLDSAGNIEWQKCLGGTNSEVAFSIQQTNNGGYILTGWTQSNNGDVAGNHGLYDSWVVKLDSAGNTQWQKCLGGTDYDVAHSIQQTNDGGYILTGLTKSNNGDVAGNHGESDYWVVKLDSAGNIEWQICLGGSFLDFAFSIQQTLDGGFIAAGETQSGDGDVNGNHGYGDFWVVKLSAVTGIEEINNQASSFSFFPNPTSDEITLQLESNTRHIISITNTLGEILFQTETNSSTLQVDVSYFTPGVYFVTVGALSDTFMVSDSFTKKFVKM